ncbi:glycosyltransferase-like protein, family 2 [Capnocytophaga sp. oral taxon 335 str. F0486]|uniref:glycosyltransferase family 2 protein n=1 Tax=Capnocytophaga sp. oral taxon 335 TaxID=712215 RepID=UPI00026F4218|nr:glycosyltransferase family 2 protein [Capnocytophaga sp. oral taxon 335]EJF37093.1 glycosyltransferase-like protein, family 2 [Capnocytophaga sp. oral taxon 335 str. F0486]
MVTIGLPFYNAEKYLALAIESVLQQTYTDWELLLLDDGSTDNSLSIAQSYAQKDSRIRVLSDSKNRKSGYRHNQAAQLTKTKYLAKMDADDMMHPNRIARQVEILETHSEIDVLGTNAYIINDDNKVIGTRYPIDSEERLERVKDFMQPTIMAKTEWFLTNPYDIEAIRLEDAELWYRTHSKYHFVRLNEPLLFYREVGNNYYKKYFLAQQSKAYIFSKYPNESYWKHYFRANFLKGIVYRIAHIFGMEQWLVNRRNVKISPVKPYTAYQDENKTI